MIKLAIAGPQDFTNDLQRRIQREKIEISLMNVTSDPAQTMEAIENPKLNADAILMGYDDREIEIIAELAVRNKMKAVLFVSTDDPSKAFYKWAKYKIKVAKRNKELATILHYFYERPGLISEKTPAQTMYDEEERGDSVARVEMVKNQDRGSHNVLEKKVIVVYGPKGGIGKSVTVVSMAKSIVALTGLRVAILDLEFNRDYGDILRYFGCLEDKKAKMVELKTPDWAKGMALPQEKTLSGWSRFPWEHRHNRQVVEESLVKIDNNLFLLPPLRSIMDEKSITYDGVKKTIDVLQRNFQVVIIDGSNTLTDSTLAAIEMCDNLLITASASVPVIDSLADFVISTINKIEAQPVIGFIINDVAADFPDNFNLETDVPKLAGGFPVYALLPKDDDLRKMVNNKAIVPYIGGNDIPFTRGIQKLLGAIFPMAAFAEKQKPKGGIWNSIVKKIRKASA